MKTIFISEFYPPYDSGGAEWSTFFLASKLAKEKVKVTVLTPNYGFKKSKAQNGVKVIRYPFYSKYKNNNLPGNFALTNPIWILWSTFFICIELFKEKPDLIHVQGKYSICPTVLANLLTRKPIVTTIRDYIAICNYGMCLLKSDKACNLFEYFFNDFNIYYKNYVKDKKFLVYLLNIVYAVYGRVSKNLIKYFVNKVDIITCMSYKEEKILKNNGIQVKTIVIRNTFEFPTPINLIKPKKRILFVGRLTSGKGVDLLLKTIPFVLKKYKSYNFDFAGAGPLAKKIQNYSKKNKHTTFLGQVLHDKLHKFYMQSTLTIVPSLWQEPFSRVVIESLSYGTPVIVTNSGGLPEAIVEGQYGYVSKKNSLDLAAKIIKGIVNNTNLRKSIKRDFKLLQKKYTEDVVKNHIDLYKSLIK